MKLALALVLLIATGAPARADDGYRFEVATVDTVGASLFVGGLFVDADPLSAAMLLTGMAVGTLGGPVDHAAHGRWTDAGLSLGAHLALPVLGGAIGGSVTDAKGLDVIAPMLGGAVLGHLAASAIDIALARATSSDPATPRIVSIGGHF